MAVLSGVGALTVNIPDEVYEYARGDNITLPCRFQTAVKDKVIVITWSVEAVQINAKEVRSLRCVNILYVHVCDSLLSGYHDQHNPNSFVLYCE